VGAPGRDWHLRIPMDRGSPRAARSILMVAPSALGEPQRPLLQSKPRGPGIGDFLQNSRNRLGDSPAWEMRF